MQRYVFRCPVCGTTWQAVDAYARMLPRGSNPYDGHNPYLCDCYENPRIYKPVLPPQVVELATGTVVAEPSTYDDLRDMAYLIEH